MKAWIDNSYCGTVRAATGVGKTRLGIEAIKQFQPYAKTLIVVPTVALQKQWKQELLDAGCPEDQIGLIGDNNNDYNKKFIIGIKDSIRKINIKVELLILDEVHTILSEKNVNIFYCVEYKYILALSATPERSDNNHKFLYTRAPLVYNYDIKEGIDDKVLCKFILENIAVSLTPTENAVLQRHNLLIQHGMSEFKSLNNIICSCRRGSWSQRSSAASVMRAIQARKKLLSCCKNKIIAITEILQSYDDIPKTIVFCEHIDMAETIAESLDKNNIKVAVYHSKLDKAIRKGFLEDYGNDIYRVIIAVNCLNLGLNVPDTELGIIIAGTSVPIQFKQRLGRVLRAKPGKIAKLIQLYVPGSKDSDWMNSRSSRLKPIAEKVIYK